MASSLNKEIERIKRAVANGYPGRDFKITDNEVSLYWEAAAAKAVVGSAFAGYQVDGVISLVDGYITTIKYSALSEDDDSGDSYVDLPNPPLGLPLGYSIPSVSIVGRGSRNIDLIPVQPKQVPLYRQMEKPNGAFYWVEGNRLWTYPVVFLDDNEKLLVKMSNAKTDDRSAVINLPEDLIEGIFITVRNQLMERYKLPQDVRNDGNDIRG